MGSDRRGEGNFLEIDNTKNRKMCRVSGVLPREEMSMLNLCKVAAFCGLAAALVGCQMKSRNLIVESGPPISEVDFRGNWLGLAWEDVFLFRLTLESSNTMKAALHSRVTSEVELLPGSWHFDPITSKAFIRFADSDISSMELTSRTQTTLSGHVRWKSGASMEIEFVNESSLLNRHQLLSKAME